MSDLEILERLGISDYKLVTDENERNQEIQSKRYLFLTEDDDWTHIADDWFYTLWHNSEIIERIKFLSIYFEIFTCYVGDSDESFGFSYFKNGQIIRQYSVEDPEYKGGEVIRNIGNPFYIEQIALKKEDIYDKVMSIAQSFGINLNHKKDSIRVYGKFAD